MVMETMVSTENICHMFVEMMANEINNPPRNNGSRQEVTTAFPQVKAQTEAQTIVQLDNLFDFQILQFATVAQTATMVETAPLVENSAVRVITYFTLVFLILLATILFS